MDSFNAMLPDLKQSFGAGAETWVIDKQVSGEIIIPAPTGGWTVISVDKQTYTTKVMIGGNYVEKAVMIYVDIATFKASGVRKGCIIKVTGPNGCERYNVLEIDDDGDAAKTLVCSTPQIGFMK